MRRGSAGTTRRIEEEEEAYSGAASGHDSSCMCSCTPAAEDNAHQPPDDGPNKKDLQSANMATVAAAAAAAAVSAVDAAAAAAAEPAAVDSASWRSRADYWKVGRYGTWGKGERSPARGRSLNQNSLLLLYCLALVYQEG